jgi:hypothetical protein
MIAVLRRSRPRRAVSALAVLLAAGCRDDPGPQRIIAQELAITRQIEGLRELIATAERGSLVPSDRVIIAVEEQLVRDLAQLALPREEVIGGRFRVRLEQADVRFQDKWGSVRLDGRVRPAEGSAEDMFAEVAVFGLMDAVEVDPTTGELSGKVTPLGFEVRRVGVYGESSAGRRMLEAFGRTRLQDLSALTFPVHFPVRLEQEVVLGGLADGPVRIHPAKVPLKFSVHDVSAHGERLWVTVDVAEGRWVKVASTTPSSGARP